MCLFDCLFVFVLFYFVLFFRCRPYSRFKGSKEFKCLSILVLLEMFLSGQYYELLSLTRFYVCVMKMLIQM